MADSSVHPANEDDTRHRLLRAAGPIFADRGYQNATVREICGAARVNVASVGYYFGDKMGLYREVINGIRNEKSRRFPIPDKATYTDSQERLFVFIHILLRRMLEDGPDGWQIRLLLREMERPTAALMTIVRDHFRPVFEQLCSTLAEIMQSVDERSIAHLSPSVIGQCLHYRVSRQAIEQLMEQSGMESEIDIDSLAVHITSVTLAAATGEFSKHQSRLWASLRARQQQSIGDSEVLTPLNFESQTDLIND